MGLLELLGANRNNRGVLPRSRRHGDTETVKRIITELESLEPTWARFLAAFAYVLNRVAHADSKISQSETTAIREIVRRWGHLSEKQARLVVEIAQNQAQLFGGTENYLVTRELRETSTTEQQLEVLNCIFAVATADGKISATEETQIGQIAKELGITQRVYASALSAHAEHRTVIRSLRALQTEPSQ